jgi:hypothetical protein
VELGGLPSVVYRSDAPAVLVLMVTVWAVAKVPPPGLKAGADTWPPPADGTSCR